MSRGLAHNVCVYAGCGFRSHDKSLWANEITKTKLQTNTQARSLHKHAVAGSGASTQTYFVTKQSTVTGCHLQSSLHLQFLTTTRPRVWSLSSEAQSVGLHLFVTVICAKKVHRAGCYFSVLFTDCISCRVMSKWLFAVTRSRKSPVTKNFLKIKSATCPRCRKVVGLLRNIHGDELSKNSAVTHVNI